MSEAWRLQVLCEWLELELEAGSREGQVTGYLDPEFASSYRCT